jgi:hypothetical protein
MRWSQGDYGVYVCREAYEDAVQLAYWVIMVVVEKIGVMMMENEFSIAICITDTSDGLILQEVKCCIFHLHPWLVGY